MVLAADREEFPCVGEESAVSLLSSLSPPYKKMARISPPFQVRKSETQEL